MPTLNERWLGGPFSPEAGPFVDGKKDQTVTSSEMAAKMLVRTVWLSVIIVQAAGFMAPTYTPLIRTSRGACDRVGIQMADDINTKKVAGCEDPIDPAAHANTAS